MATNMRAKMTIESVQVYRVSNGYEQETLKFRAVSKKEPYGENGLDEDNTYAKFTPSASLEITIANPALLGKFNPGETFYVDFTPVPQTTENPQTIA